MAKARGHDEWNRTADLMALLANLQAGETRFSREDYHPYLQSLVVEKVGMGGFASILPHTTAEAPS